MTKKVRVGIIGGGWPGQQHARAVRPSQHAVLQALAEPNEERAAEFSQTYAPRTAYPDYADLLGDPKVDARRDLSPQLSPLSRDPRRARSGQTRSLRETADPAPAPR